MIGRVVVDVIVLMTSVIYLMTLFFISACRGDRSEEEVVEPVRPRRRQDLMCPSCLHQKADENRPGIHHGNPRAHTFVLLLIEHQGSACLVADGAADESGG